MPDGSALVTGGTRGIGRAIAHDLARRGWPVALVYRRDVEQAKACVSAIEAAGGEAVAIEADVSSSAAVDDAFTHAEDVFGPVQVLINNAGIRRDGLAIRMQDDAWHDVLATNLFGAFACSRRALRAMVRARWGRIVNITSVAGLRASSGQANYSASKAGLIALTKTLAAEVASKGITVNAVAPGLVETDLVADLSSVARETLVGRIPARAVASAEDIAPLVGFICSDAARYMTGEVVVLDGGMTA